MVDWERESKTKHVYAYFSDYPSITKHKITVMLFYPFDLHTVISRLLYYMHRLIDQANQNIHGVGYSVYIKARVIPKYCG